MPSPMHVWITGAGSGLGAAIARKLPPQCMITLSGRNLAALEAMAEHIGRDRSIVCQCDVSDINAITALHRDAVARFGPVDVLVNNAGIAEFTELVETQLESFERQIDVNLVGAIRCIKAILPSMIERRRGMILTMNSVAATTSFTSCTGYAASKAGLLAATRSLRQEVRHHGIKVVDVILGATATGIWSEAMLAEHGERMINPDDVAQMVESVIFTLDNPTFLVEELTIRPHLGDL